MKKGRVGKQKKEKLPSGKARLAAAKSRIKKILAKAKKAIFSKVRGKKSPALKSKKTSPAMSQPVLQASTAISFPDPDLPSSYNLTKLELLVRDPEWAYAYWDFSGETWAWVTKLFEEDASSRAKLRIYNLSHQTSYNLDVQLEAKNWYVNLGFPDTEFEAELGLLDSKGRFYSIVKSNRVRTPRNGLSKVVDPLWDPSEFSDVTQLSGRDTQLFSASLFSSVFSPRLKKT